MQAVMRGGEGGGVTSGATCTTAFQWACWASYCCCRRWADSCACRTSPCSAAVVVRSSCCLQGPHPRSATQPCAPVCPEWIRPLTGTS